MLLKVRLLGAFEIRQNGNPIELKSRNAQSLLAILALNPNKPFRREELAGLLWPDSDEQSARNYLRQALWQLRRAIGKDRILSNRVTIELCRDEDYEVDVGLFLNRADRRTGEDGADNLIENLTHYQGHLLPGFYEGWIEPHRRQLQRVLETRMESLLPHLLAKGRNQEAIEWGEKWIEWNKAPEAAFRMLMQAYANNGDLASVASVYQRCVDTLEQELSVTPSEQTQDLFFRLSQQGPDSLRNPYRGLSPFREEDAPFFFGREAYTSRLHKMVSDEPLCVLGGISGSGKSSVVSAGLIPRLADEGRWTILKTRPGREPFVAIASQLAQIANKGAKLDVGQLSEKLKTREIELGEFLNEFSSVSPEKRVLVAIDQFEELFALGNNKGQKEFLKFILESVSSAQSGSRVSFLIVIRADYFQDILAFRPLADAIQASTLMMGPMNQVEMRRAIINPASKAGALFEQGLAERIMDNIGVDQGKLPLLQFALERLWESKSGKVITNKSFDELGKIEGTLARYAEDVYRGLSPGEKKAARQILLQMVQPGERSADIRRSVSREQFTGPDWKLVEKLANARIVVLSHDAMGRDVAELIHEILITAWTRLGSWIDENRAFRKWQEFLRINLSTWEENQRDQLALLRGIHLVEAKQWLSDRRSEISGAEETYIQQSDEFQRSREQEKEKVRRRVFYGLSLGLAVSLLVSLFSFSSWRTAERAEREALEAFSRNLAAGAEQALSVGDNSTALLLAKLAIEIENAPEELTQVLRNAASSPGPRREFDASSYNTSETGAFVTAVEVAPDGKHAIVGASADGALAMIDLESGEIANWFYGHSSFITEMDFVGDGSRFASGGEDGRIIVWDTESGEMEHELQGQSSWVNAVDISPDGALIVSGAMGIGDDLMDLLTLPGEIVVWDLENGSELMKLEGGHAQAIIDVVFSYDGRYVLSNSGLRKAYSLVQPISNTVVWDAESGAIIQSFDAIIDNPTKIAVSPNAHVAAIGSMENTVYIIDYLSGEVLRILEGHDDWINDLEYGNDGRSLFVSTGSGSTHLWDAETGERIAHFAMHQGEVSSISMFPETEEAISSGVDGRIYVWALDDEAVLGEFAHNSQDVASIEYLPNGKEFLASSENFGIDLWDIETGTLLREFQGHGARINDISVNSSGEYAISASDDGTVIVWDLVSGRVLNIFEGHNAEVNSVVFHPDGQSVFSASSDFSILQWDLISGEIIQRFAGHTFPVDRFEISPDGSVGTSVSLEGILVWDVSTGSRIASLSTDEGYQVLSSSLAISPSGNVIVSSSESFFTDLVFWDSTTGKELARIPNDKPVSDIAITHDSKWALVSFLDGKIWQIDLDTFQLEREYSSSPGTPVWDVETDPTSNVFLSAGLGGPVILWEIDESSRIEVLEWIGENRILMSLECEEQIGLGLGEDCLETGEEIVAQTTNPSDSIALQEDSISQEPKRASIGENLGEILPGRTDVWYFEADAGEQITIIAEAGRPLNDSSLEEGLDQNLLDLAIAITDSGKNILATNAFEVIGDRYLSDAAIRSFVVPQDDVFEVHVSGELIFTGGPYTLEIILEN